MGFLHLVGQANNMIAQASAIAGTSEDSAHPWTNVGLGMAWKRGRFATAAADDHVTADLGSAKQPTLSSIHMHNIDPSGITVELRRSTDNFSSSNVLVATFTLSVPAIYVSFAQPTASRYWRLLFDGTNSSPIYVGEWWLGVPVTLASTCRALNVRDRMLQTPIAMGGDDWTLGYLNRQKDELRELDMEFYHRTDAEKAELQTMLRNMDWGREPGVIVPDTNREIVVLGRPAPGGFSSQSVGVSSWRSGLTWVEDPGPEVTT